MLFDAKQLWLVAASAVHGLTLLLAPVFAAWLCCAAVTPTSASARWTLETTVSILGRRQALISVRCSGLHSYERAVAAPFALPTDL